MADAAVAWLAARGLDPAGGIVIAPADALGEGGMLPQAAGDHPEPGERSFAAADRLGEVIAAVGPDDAVLVLLSGGASSLVASPIPGVTRAELTELWRILLGAGVDIHAMNAIRRRFTRWGGGRLARALAPRRVEVLAISDVPGDDPATIGSGPCAGDPLQPADLGRLLAIHGLTARVPKRLLQLLERVSPEVATVPPGAPALRRVQTRIVAANADAVAAAASCASKLGWDVQSYSAPVVGDAAAAGRTLAAELIAAEARPGTIGACIVCGGETTVTLTGNSVDGERLGGRCQELALAASEVLAEHHVGTTVAVLAAGTDGRDGPTDAAGAIVDGETWKRMEMAGRDPRADLAQHRSYAALDAAGALVRSGPTGTNVMDLVIALRVVLPRRSEIAPEKNGDVDPSH